MCVVYVCECVCIIRKRVWMRQKDKKRTTSAQTHTHSHRTSERMQKKTTFTRTVHTHISPRQVWITNDCERFLNATRLTKSDHGRTIVIERRKEKKVVKIRIRMCVWSVFLPASCGIRFESLTFGPEEKIARGGSNNSTEEKKQQYHYNRILIFVWVCVHT